MHSMGMVSVNKALQTLKKTINLRMCWLRLLVLLFAVIAHGGTAAGTRSLELMEAEGDAPVTQEATDTRRDSTSSRKLGGRRVAKIEERQTKRESPSRHSRLRSADEKSPVCDCFV